ncbi:MAG: YIP1 family protein [bacterium]
MSTKVILPQYLAGALIRWTGKWIGGQAPSQNIRAAIAWSSVPTIWALILWIPQLVLFGQELFTTETPRIHASPSLGFISLGFVAIQLIIAIWAIVVFLKCLGQVQGFSAWRALGNTTLGALVIVVPIAIIAIIVVCIAR